MTDAEAKAFRELVYIAREIACCMAAQPDLTALQIAGSIGDSDSELARLSRAIDAAGRMVFSAWDHRHADEIR